MLKHCFFAEFQLIEGYIHQALKKELLMIPFIERFKQLLLESLTDKFYHYLEEFAKALHFC